MLSWDIESLTQVAALQARELKEQYNRVAARRGQTSREDIIIGARRYPPERQQASVQSRIFDIRSEQDTQLGTHLLPFLQNLRASTTLQVCSNDGYK